MNLNFLRNKSILITGGTGSFGESFTEFLLKKSKNISRIAIYSRDELKQSQLQLKFKKNKNLRFFIGDIRDKQRLAYALEDIDYVIHAAALKQVPTVELNPLEAIKTNVLGAQNLIEACLQTNVKKVIALSSDKAVAPINLYGATKLCSDKLFIASNNYSGKKDISFSVIRYGNVMGSRGSVLPIFLNQKKSGIVTLTHKDMTRFNILMEDCIKMVIWSLKNAHGGEIFVPKIPSFRIIDLAKVITPECKVKYIGIRSGEKIHEEMITGNESQDIFDIGKYYVLLPSKDLVQRKKYSKFKQIKYGFSYSSDKNKDFLNLTDLRKLVKKYMK
jgi:UDP-N-acetylglucosamine 4,6-dehydratase (inverting)